MTPISVNTFAFLSFDDLYTPDPQVLRPVPLIALMIFESIFAFFFFLWLLM